MSDSSRFNQRVKELIPDDVDKEKLFDCLRSYQSNHDLHGLLSDLRFLLNEPSKLELYEYMRPLILLQHQIEYSRRTPTLPGMKLRLVRLFHRPGESLGFAVRGGFEHSVGIFVTQVTPGSQAERQGLRVGDEVVKVNGFTIAEAIHDDVLSLIKSRDEIILKVTYIGMVPVKDEPTDPVTWQYVETLDDSINEESMHKKRQSADIPVFIDSTGHASLGCSILSESGPAANFPGIYVEKVRPGSIADQVGLEPGDQIMEVNETSFRKITWEQAVLALKSSRQLNIVIRKKTGSKLIQRWSSNGSTAGSNRHNSVAADTDVPASPLGLSDIEPIYSTVNKGARTSHAAERRTSTSNPPNELNEMDLIEQQLNRTSSIQASSNLHSDRKPPSQASIELPPSPMYSSISSASSVISTAAEVYRTPFHSNISSRHEASRSSITKEPHYPQRSALGGAAAMMAERRLHSNTSNTPELLGPPDDYEWSDIVRGQVYTMFSSSILDGRRLLCLTYNKNGDLGIDIEGGLGSPLGGKILVAVLFDGGIARKSGKIRVGDQLMMINGQILLGVTAAEAERIIQGVASNAKDKVELFYCESTLVNDESSSTYF